MGTPGRREAFLTKRLAERSEELKRTKDALRRSRRALTLIDTYAWVAVRCDCLPATRELQRRIEVCRAELRRMG
jgi:hypothetical protein